MKSYHPDLGVFDDFEFDDLDKFYKHEPASFQIPDAEDDVVCVKCGSLSFNVAKGEWLTEDQIPEYLRKPIWVKGFKWELWSGIFVAGLLNLFFIFVGRVLN